MLFSNLAYLLIIFFLIYKLTRNDFNEFQALIFVIPFHSWFYNIGLNLTVFQIVTIIVLLSTVVVKGRNILYVGNIYVILFFLFAITDTIIISVFVIDKYLELGNYFRSEGRYLAQLAFFLITFSIIPLAFNYIKNVQDVLRCFRSYILALIILLIFGWVQYFAYSLSGIDLFPLSVDEFGKSRSGIYIFKGIKVFRMSSLGGEPKGFSLSLILGFFIIHIFNKQSISFFKYDVLLKYIFLFTAFATLSTSGMVLFVCLYVVYFIYDVTLSKKNYKVKSIKMIYAAMIFFAILFLLIKYWDLVSYIIEKRIFERDVASEDYDAPIQILLSKFPEYLLFGSGLGNIHNLAYPYIHYEHLHYMAENIFVAKSGYLRITSELGLIGLSLFIIMVTSVYRKLGVVGKSLYFENRKSLYAIQFLLVLVMTAYFARGYVVSEFYFLLAIANVLAQSKKIRQRVNK